MASTVTLTQQVFTFSLKNKTLQEKVNKAIKDMKKDGTLLPRFQRSSLLVKTLQRKTKVDYTEIDISDVE